MRMLDNTSIGYKSLISPLFSCLMALLIGFVLYASSSSISAAVDQNQRQVTFSKNMDETTIYLMETHLNLYKALNWKQTNVDSKLINQLLEDVASSIEMAKNGIISISTKTTGLSEDEVKKIQTNIANYETSYKQVVEMLDLDISMANIFLNDCQSRYAPLQDILEKVSRKANLDATKSSKEMKEVVKQNLVTGLVCVALMIVFGLMIGGYIGKAIARPIKAITDVMKALAQGDMSVDIPGTERGDEVGAMAAAVSVFKENMIRNEGLEAEQAQERKTRERRAQMIEKHVAEFQTNSLSAVQSVSSAAGQLQKSSKTLTVAADQTSNQADVVSKASFEASQNVQTVSAAAEELHASISEIERRVTESARLAAEAVQETIQTNKTVEGLSTAAQKIGSVVELITEIASQTNLLALNATIEAARAGEAGKGFAVVAQEVKGLAEQTAKATQEIAGQVQEMQSVTSSTVEAIKKIGATITHLNEISTTIAAAVEEQSSATDEIARSIEQASIGTNTVSSSITGVTEASKETTQMAKQVDEAGNRLNDEASRLRASIEGFINNVRSA